MFTGIVSDIGRIRAVAPSGDPCFVIETSYETVEIPLGASIAHSGICLTVIETGSDWFKVQVSAETLSLTTAKHWKVGTRLNLERALRFGDELGGHIVSGHVDGVGRVVALQPENDSLRMIFAVPDDLASFIAPKGSITIDGVSLTVNEVEKSSFGINVIPHTQSHTTLGTARQGDSVNLEVDMLARYVARLLNKEKK